jgi:formamidopyrimidine-DNA glycosylase
VPELPDVEVFRRYLASTALHQRLTNVRVTEKRVLGRVSASRLKNGVGGRSLEDTKRHGKHLFVRLTADGADSASPSLVFHFGMTGFFKYYKDEGSAPGHPRVTFDFENGYRLAYDCQRMLGEVELVDSPASYADAHGLGPDALELGEDELAERLRGRRGALKNALMKQELLSGIGNVYSDEISFHAGLDPATEVKALEEGALAQLYRTMRWVLETAIERKADPDAVPSDWLLAVRDRGDRCPKCGSELERRRVSGRSAWSCPRCQKTPKRRS